MGEHGDTVMARGGSSARSAHADPMQPGEHPKNTLPYLVSLNREIWRSPLLGERVF